MYQEDVAPERDENQLPEGPQAQLPEMAPEGVEVQLPHQPPALLSLSADGLRVYIGNANWILNRDWGRILLAEEPAKFLNGITKEVVKNNQGMRYSITGITNAHDANVIPFTPEIVNSTKELLKVYLAIGCDEEFNIAHDSEQDFIRNCPSAERLYRQFVAVDGRKPMAKLLRAMGDAVRKR